MSIRKIVGAVAAVVCLMGVTAEAGNAIGVRVGQGGYLFGEINFQMGMGSSNRLEIGAQLSESHIGGAVVYQWVFDLPAGFKWYAGAGAWAGYGDDLSVSANGQIGIEYNFSSIPLQLSLDTRPGISIIPEFANFSGDRIALGIRYTF